MKEEILWLILDDMGSKRKNKCVHRLLIVVKERESEWWEGWEEEEEMESFMGKICVSISHIW